MRGYRATLGDEDCGTHGTRSFPVHLLADVAGYTLEAPSRTEALRRATGTGIVFEFVQACRRGSGVREVVFGLRSTEDPLLVAFKEHLGFSVVQVPAKARINRLVAAVVRRWRPHEYYRLTGIVPATAYHAGESRTLTSTGAAGRGFRLAG